MAALSIRLVERLAVTSWQRHSDPMWDCEQNWDRTAWEFFGIYRAALYGPNESVADVARFLCDIAHERGRQVR